MLRVTTVAIIAATTLFSAQTNGQKPYKAEDDLKKGGEGYYYYNDYREEPQEQPKVPQRPQVKPGDNGQLADLIQAVRENTEVSKKILEKLEYAYPRTIPEWTKNSKTGEKCKSNSSADCFVMPVIAEAQNSVPVMVDMMRNPTTENVKKYLEWQAAYFNQTFKIGYGFNLTSQQYERDAWKVDGMGFTQMPEHGNKQDDAQYLKIAAIIKKLNNKLGMLVFFGKSEEIEREFSGREFNSITKGPFSKLKNTAFIFENQATLNRMTNLVNQDAYTDYPAQWAAMKKAVDPAKFKEFKIHASPAAVLIYKKDDGEIIWQKLGYISTVSEQQIMLMTYRFLRFHEIIPAGSINEEDVWESADRMRKGEGFDASLLNKIKVDESSLNVPDDQIIKRKEK